MTEVILVPLTPDDREQFSKVRRFVEEATKYEMYLELEESTQAYEFAQTLYFENEKKPNFDSTCLPTLARSEKETYELNIN